MQLIDLDAAMRQGENSALVAQICKRLPCRWAEGFVPWSRRKQVLDAGARRVIVGSALFSEGGVNTAFAAELAAAVGAAKLVAGIDSKGRAHRGKGLESPGGIDAR